MNKWEKNAFCRKRVNLDGKRNFNHVEEELWPRLHQKRAALKRGARGRSLARLRHAALMHDPCAMRVGVECLQYVLHRRKLPDFQHRSPLECAWRGYVRGERANVAFGVHCSKNAAEANLIYLNRHIRTNHAEPWFSMEPSKPRRGRASAPRGPARASQNGENPSRS